MAMFKDFQVGDDIWGDRYIDNLKSYSIDTRFVSKTSNTSTGTAQITVSQSGENQIVIVAGANKCLTTQDIENASNAIRNAKVLVLQLETTVDIALKVLSPHSNCISILNGAPALSNYDPKLLSLPTIFCVNETEAEIFSGLSVNNERYAIINV